MGQTIDDLRKQFAQSVKAPEPKPERQAKGRGQARRIIHHISEIEFVFPGGYSSTVKSHVSLLALRQYKRRQRYLTFNDEMDAVIMFGKHKGKTVSVIHWEAPDYLRWMTTQDFDPALMDVIKKWTGPAQPWMRDIQKDGPDYEGSHIDTIKDGSHGDVIKTGSGAIEDEEGWGEEDFDEEEDEVESWSLRKERRT